MADSISLQVVGLAPTGRGSTRLAPMLWEPGKDQDDADAQAIVDRPGAAFGGLPDRRLDAAGRLSPDTPDRDRRTGVGHFPARERPAPMGRLVALGQDRPERKNLVRGTAGRPRRDV